MSPLAPYLKSKDHCESAMPTKWEYKTLKIPTEFAFFSGTDFDAAQLTEQLNSQGDFGWELVSIFDIEKQRGGSKFVIAVMKRPKE